MKQYVYDFYGENELEEVIDRFRQERRERRGFLLPFIMSPTIWKKLRRAYRH